MATEEVTGATKQELEDLRRDQHVGTRAHENDVPFETAFCLTKIGRQPDDYDGPPRYCRRRACKLTHEEWDERYPDRPFRNFEPESYWPSCPFHGRKNGDHTEKGLIEPGMANLKHGMYASDERLREDFSEADEELYEEILEWAEIYDFPPREEDPARWKLLEKLAINEVRSVRGYLYLYDEGEIQLRDIYDENGVLVGEEPEENALATEYRLLQRSLLDIMKELGLTPKEQSKMTAEQTEANASERLAEVAEEALSEDQDYDPTEFEG